MEASDRAKDTVMVSKRAKQDDSERKKPLRLRCVGFCGIDHTSVESEEKHAWPSFVEWGVLFRPEKEGHHRFPPMDWVRAFSASNTKLAAHLCSSRCQELLNGDFEFIKTLSELGFRRAQINATKANNVDSALLSSSNVDNIVKAAETFPSMEFIVQRNEETKVIWETLEKTKVIPDNISYLFDASVGRGIVVSTFDRPKSDSARYGYAGGLKPENIEAIVRLMHAQVPEEQSIWIDMESGIRNSADEFSTERAWKVVEIINSLSAEGVVVFED